MIWIEEVWNEKKKKVVEIYILSFFIQVAKDPPLKVGGKPTTFLRSFSDFP